MLAKTALIMAVFLKCSLELTNVEADSPNYLIFMA